MEDVFILFEPRVVTVTQDNSCVEGVDFKASLGVMIQGSI
jgi:hypothetical protein